MPFSDTVNVENGLLAVPDADSDGVRVFRGIPFAAPPVRRLRWRSPEAPEPWSGVRPVDRFGANAMRARVYDDIDPSTPEFLSLVDRLWPRGLRKSDAAIDEWDKELSPSMVLRK
jgi:hypothetical protein